ncbi:MAG TPA: iron chelate uptake ABC transporter family permease subunit, partial [Pseudonocardia sp.]
GLVVPHVVRMVTGPDYRWLLPASALAGAALLLVADVIGRVVVRPGELQVGIVLALVGGPFFVWLVRRRKMVAI